MIERETSGDTFAGGISSRLGLFDVAIWDETLMIGFFHEGLIRI